MALFAYFKNIKFWMLTGLFILNIVLFQLTLSRTGFLCVSILIMYYLVLRYLPKLTLSNGWTVFQIITYMAIVLISLISVIMLPYSRICDWLNHLLTGRLALAYNYLETYPLTIFGGRVTASYIDHGWVGMLLYWGVVSFLLYHIGMICLLVRERDKADRRISMVIILIALYTVFEFSAVEKVFRNIAILFLAELIFNSRAICDNKGALRCRSEKAAE